jgi:uncharacterized RDD family membrane protein YckC
MADREWSPAAGPLLISGRVPSGSVGGSVPPRYYLAHWWPRVGATLLDGLIVAPINIALALSFHLFTVNHQLSANGTSVPRIEYHPYVFLLFSLVYVLYTVTLLCRGGEHNGQTLGKQRLGLRVIRNDGKPVDIRTALVREGLVKTLPGVIGSVSALVSVASSFFSLLDDLWPLRSRENRAIHDHVAKTHIVQTRKQPAYAPGASETALASALAANEPPPVDGASSTLLREVPIGANVYVALRDIAPDTAGGCWIDPAAPVWTVPDNVHVVRVSHAPEGLFVSLSAAYESLLVSNPSEAAQHEQAGWRRATLSFS